MKRLFPWKAILGNIKKIGDRDYGNGKQPAVGAAFLYGLMAAGCPIYVMDKDSVVQMI